MNDYHDNDVVIHPVQTCLSPTPFSFSCAMNTAHGKSGPELLPRQQMSVLTVAMDTGQSGGDRDGVASGSGDTRAQSLGAHITECVL